MSFRRREILEMMRSRRQLVAMLAASALAQLTIILAASARPAAAHEAAAIDDIRLGINGVYKLGHWVPVNVNVRTFDHAFRGRLVVQSPDANGVAVEYVRHISEIPASTSQLCTTYVKLGQASADLLVRLEPEGGRPVVRRLAASERAAPLSTSKQIVLAVGGGLTVDPARQLRLEATWVDCSGDRARELPRHWLGYSGVDAIVLTTSRKKELALLDAAQWTALQMWVRLGGRVVVCGATRTGELFGPAENASLAWLVPGEVDGVVQQRQTSGIEQFAEATTRLDQVAPSGVRFSVPMAAVRHPHGRVEASEGFGTDQSPSVLRGAAGLGRVVFVAFDLDQPPFTTWPDQPRLLAKLMAFVLDEAETDEAVESALGPVAHVGYSDLIGQLRHSLDQFPGVRLIPFSWIAGLLVIYLAIVGPLDYWFLRRWGRPEWTWLTFGLSVTAFTCLAIVLASVLKGRDFHCNQVTLIDLDLEGGWLRGITWTHLFSPRTQSISLRTEPQMPFTWRVSPQQATGWQGLPGDGFGGLDRREPSETFKRPYQSILKMTDSHAVDDVRLERFPIAVWSSQSLLGQWWGRVQLPDAVTALSASSDGTLTGHIPNPLPVDLEDAYLIFDRWAYRLGKLPQGGVISAEGATAVDLQSHLTQRTVVEGRNVMTPWSQSDTDFNRIMQLLTFYGAAKGRVYTRLEHRYQRTIDWSDHVTANRAVLWGRAGQPGARLLLDDAPIQETQDWTYCRLLIPIARR